MINRTRELPTFPPDGRRNDDGDCGREKKAFSGLEISGRSRDVSSYSHPVPPPPMASRPNGSPSFVPPSDLAANSWPRSVLSEEKPSVGLNQKLMNSSSIFEPCPAFSSIPPPNRNGFHHGSSSSRSKEGLVASHQSVGFDFASCRNHDSARSAACSSTSKHVNGSNCVVLLSSSSNGPAPERCLKVFNYDLNSEIRKGSDRNAAPNVASASSVCADDDDDKAGRIDGKILGVPIFEGPPRGSGKEPLSLTAPPASCENRKEEGAAPGMNLASDPAAPGPVSEKGRTDSGGLIDLNSCASEEEASLPPSGPVSGQNIATGIDLEAPLVLETDEGVRPGKPEGPRDELARAAAAAADAIVSISSSAGIRSEEDGDACAFRWFAEVAFTCWDDLRAESGGRREMDYFELMTLELEEEEAEAEECSRSPPSARAGEAGPSFLPNRPRRGPGRRGRQRRDFQRDILPGLASLSRHEVTEDLQAFGGMMKATGHSWQSGPTRRNAGARGRPRSSAAAVPELNQAETGWSMKEGSLTGWGKTTRRPRRQRCSLGNAVSLPSA